MKFRLISFYLGVMLFVFSTDNSENALLGIQVDYFAITLHILFIPIVIRKKHDRYDK